jgi:hypothetical protein
LQPSVKLVVCIVKRSFILVEQNVSGSPRDEPMISHPLVRMEHALAACKHS